MRFMEGPVTDEQVKVFREIADHVAANWGNHEKSPSEHLMGPISDILAKLGLKARIDSTGLWLCDLETGEKIPWPHARIGEILKKMGNT